jgi:hypothetical protein
VRLALVPTHVGKLSPAEKLVFRDFALQHNIGLVSAETPTFVNGASALAVVGMEGDSCHVWASREVEPRLPGPAWGSPNSHPVARGRASINPQFIPIDLNTLLPAP